MCVWPFWLEGLWLPYGAKFAILPSGNLARYYKWGSTEAMLRVVGSLLIAQDTLCLMGVFPMAILWICPMMFRAQNA